jgi:hypothetical protein
MPIHFIPNDPLAISSLPMRQQDPSAERPPGVAGFAVQGSAREDLFLPGSPEFLFWQCREAALRAVATWESLTGPLLAWAPALADRQSLPVFPDDGIDINAYYDRESLRFFQHTTDGKTTFSGASTDVVAHETGHALLDSIRPDLLDSSLPETNAFHESFGDCIALLTSLADPDTRRALLAISLNLDTASFVESLMEDLADGVLRALGSSHPSSEPRHALNNFLWQLPTTLPKSGPPAVLTGEEHSFSRVFTGCFYDAIRNIFQGFPNRTEDTLWTAAQAAGKLLIAAAQKAPESPRFFQAVGRAMVLEDERMNGGAHMTALRTAEEPPRRRHRGDRWRATGQGGALPVGAAQRSRGRLGRLFDLADQLLALAAPEAHRMEQGGAEVGVRHRSAGST